ncbi:MAG: cytochrome c3 family protein [Actinobacteria bacterium]|nr:cytochrome c3 family protein [Actinomycetota bacterium]
MEKISSDIESQEAGEVVAEQAAFDEATPEGTTADKKARRGHKKPFVVLGVIAVVVVAAAVAATVWHEQPSFCNAICHSPMDSYVEGYYSGDSALLVTAHSAAGFECLDCHEPVMSEQIAEGIKWLQGDFSDPLKASRIGTVDFCYTCHNDGDASTGVDWDEIVASTVDYGGTARNPHDSHQGLIDCGQCHQMHDDSNLYCKKCHSEIATPENWSN